MTHSPLRIIALMALGYAGISLSLPAEARACSFAELTEHTLDAGEEMADTAPPETPAVEVMVIRRPATSAEAGCGTQAVSSCDGTGSVGLSITAAADDRTDSEQMGYVIELVGGDQPVNLGIPATPVRIDQDGTIWFQFSDSDQDIDMTLSVRAMDLGGNLSEPTVVQVESSGASGCSTSAGTRTGSTTMALIGMALLWSLRKRRSGLPA